MREAFRRAGTRGDIEYWIRPRPTLMLQIWSKIMQALDESGGPYHGHAGMARVGEGLRSTGTLVLHEVFADEVRGCRRKGARAWRASTLSVAADQRHRDRYHPFGWVCEMRDGALVSHMFFYSSHAEALEATGLKE